MGSTPTPLEAGKSAANKRPRRVRQTRASVRTIETLARLAISVGGAVTIVSVSAICVFLVWVVAPLFSGAELAPGREFALEARAARRAMHGALDEYGRLAWTLFDDGELELFELENGRVLQRLALFDGSAPSASAFQPRDGSGAFGFEDGSVSLARIAFSAEFLADGEIRENERQLAEGECAYREDSSVERLADGSLRRQYLSVSVTPTNPCKGAVQLIDRTDSSSTQLVCTLDATQALVLTRTSRTTDLVSGEVTRKESSCVLPYRPAPDGERPVGLLLLGAGDNVVLTWRDGRAVRYDVRDFGAPAEVESIDLAPSPGSTITAMAPMIGKRTLLVGDSQGVVRAWFRTKPLDALSTDGARLDCGRTLRVSDAAVVGLAPSSASRAFAAAAADGNVRMFNLTSGRQIGSAALGSSDSGLLLALSPRENLLLARTDRAGTAWPVESEHHEASVAALFGEVWYESYPAPAHVWQSSSGADDFEPKLGLAPLIFGTLKATLYSLLFGVPLALLAALYSSEFLAPRLRVGVKSTIEIMAGLPSVVLGFLAAIVLAPLVQATLSAVLTSFFAVPFALLVGAHLWQLLPQNLAVRWQGAVRLAFIGATIPAGLGLAYLLGPSVERALFAGDIQSWLNRSRGDAFGGWIFLLTPLSVAAVTLFSTRSVAPRLRRMSLTWSRARCARLDFAHFAAVLLASLVLAVAAAAALDAVGLDPRGSLVDTYVQRNALIVGFMMGFAIIPIIYTLAEDALTSVPQHLRLASLGAGATPWQTAMRVVVPTAASGLFSAVMVGLGRAVGETMIVLMAAGNTPMMQWNIFSGFRTLSANLAVELPEAVAGSTHFRTLFLAALSLFAITFVVNTAAEVVRQRFRKRAYQL
jgi:phosphate transport system permease protein